MFRNNDLEVEEAGATVGGGGCTSHEILPSAWEGTRAKARGEGCLAQTIRYNKTH